MNSKILYKNKNYFVYKIKNLINKKIYIGYSIHPILRYRDHLVLSIDKKVKNRRLYSAIRKHGISNFLVKILGEFQTKEEVKLVETYFINYYDSFNPLKGYNMTLGGDGGDTFSQKTDKEKQITRKNMSKAVSGEKNPFYGKTHSPEFCKHLSEQKTGVPNPKVSEALKKRYIEDKEYRIELKNRTRRAKSSIHIQKILILKANETFVFKFYKYLKPIRGQQNYLIKSIRFLNKYFPFEDYKYNKHCIMTLFKEMS